MPKTPKAKTTKKTASKKKKPEKTSRPKKASNQKKTANTGNKLSRSEFRDCEKYIRDNLEICGVNTEIVGNILDYRRVIFCCDPFNNMGLKNVDPYATARGVIHKYMSNGTRRPFNLGYIDWEARIRNKYGHYLFSYSDMERFWSEPQDSDDLIYCPLMSTAYLWVRSTVYKSYKNDSDEIYNNPEHDQLVREIHAGYFDTRTGKRMKYTQRKIFQEEWRSLLKTMLGEYTLQCRVITFFAAAWLDARVEGDKGKEKRPVRGAGLTSEQSSFILGAGEQKKMVIVKRFEKQFGFAIDARTVQKYRNKQ